MTLRKKDYGMLLFATAPIMFIIWIAFAIKYDVITSTLYVAEDAIITFLILVWADFVVSIFDDDKQIKQRNNEDKSTTS